MQLSRHEITIYNPTILTFAITEVMAIVLAAATGYSCYVGSGKFFSISNILFAVIAVLTIIILSRLRKKLDIASEKAQSNLSKIKTIYYTWRSVWAITSIYIFWKISEMGPMEKSEAIHMATLFGVYLILSLAINHIIDINLKKLIV